MDLTNRILAASILCTLAGCAGAAGTETQTSQPQGKSAPAQPAAAALVRGSVTASLRTQSAEGCQPLGLPLTAFITDAFGRQAMVADDATAMSETECLHEQQLDASAGAWTTLAENVICGGVVATGCNVLENRQCAAEQLMKWAEKRSEPVTTRGRSIGFEFTLPPQDQPARMALYASAQHEVDRLLDETMQRMDNAVSTAGCPNQSSAGMFEAYVHAQTIASQISDIMNKTAVQGR
jgi:hypothetical protein